MAARVRLVTPGQTGTDPDGIETPILAGDVELDSTAQIRGTLDLTTSGTWPASSSDPLAPFGQEAYVERGLRFGNGVTEWVSLGYFRLEDLEEAETPTGILRLSGSDRMAGLVDAQLEAPVQFAATATYGDVLEQLVTAVYPAAVIEWDDTSDAQQLGRQLVAEEDRHGFLEELVTALGKVWFWDYRGVLVIRDAPDPAAPVTELDAGEGGVLVSMGRALSRKGVYNGVVATGEAPDTGVPVWALAVDDNPDSPTYYHGPFGPVPQFFNSELLTTTEQAAKAASTLLAKQLGLPYNVDLSAVPNPALEPLDPVTVVYPAVPRGRLYQRETHVIEKLTVGLTADADLKATTREQTAVMIGVSS
jgi:hypothetical protein